MGTVDNIQSGHLQLYFYFVLLLHVRPCLVSLPLSLTYTDITVQMMYNISRSRPSVSISSFKPCYAYILFHDSSMYTSLTYIFHRDLIHDKQKIIYIKKLAI